MSTSKQTPDPQEQSDMQVAASLILDREERRQQAARERAKRKRRERRRKEKEAVARMHTSIEIIKWCILAICGVWVLSFMISIFVLVQVSNKVSEVEAQVDRIRKVIDNPFASAGARLGGQVDDKIREFLGVPPAEPQKND